MQISYKNHPKLVFEKIELNKLKALATFYRPFSQFSVIGFVLHNYNFIILFFAGIYALCVRHRHQKKHLDRIDRYVFFARFRSLTALLAPLLLPLHTYGQKRVLFPHTS